jgi:hypothetical protein
VIAIRFDTPIEELYERRPVEQSFSPRQLSATGYAI